MLARGLLYYIYSRNQAMTASEWNPRYRFSVRFSHSRSNLMKVDVIRNLMKVDVIR